MARVQRSGTRLALAVCCGALAVPAAASANHMGDMPWCPHANVQGADPADQVPGAGGGSTAAGAPSTAPLGTATQGMPSSSASGPSGEATRSSRAASGVTQQVAATQPAAVPAGVAEGVQSARRTATAAVATRTALTPAARVQARAKARADARAQARREARGLARARAVARAEQARRAQGTRLALQTRLTTAEPWLTDEARSDTASGFSPTAPAGILVALLALGGLAAALVRRRRTGGSGTVATIGVPPTGPWGADAAAIEAELQEIIAEERAARTGKERSPALLR